MYKLQRVCVGVDNKKGKVAIAKIKLAQICGNAMRQAFMLFLVIFTLNPMRYKLHFLVRQYLCSKLHKKTHRLTASLTQSSK